MQLVFILQVCKALGEEKHSKFFSMNEDKGIHPLGNAIVVPFHTLLITSTKLPLPTCHLVLNMACHIFQEHYMHLWTMYQCFSFFLSFFLSFHFSAFIFQAILCIRDQIRLCHNANGLHHGNLSDPNFYIYQLNAFHITLKYSLSVFFFSPRILYFNCKLFLL